MQTNHLSHFLLTKELFPLLNKKAEATGDARVVNHSSIAAWTDKAALEEQFFGKNGGSLGGDPPDDGPNEPLTNKNPSWKRYSQTKVS